MKIYICERNSHHKNIESLRKMVVANKIDYTFHGDLSRLDETYDIALCCTHFYPPDQFPKNCKVVYGPQIFDYHTWISHPLHNYEYDQTRFFYNILCDWNSIVYKTFAPYLSLKPISVPFGIDTENIKIVPEIEKRTKIMVYFKGRHPSCLNAVLRLLEERKQPTIVFKYGSYKDDVFKQNLQDTKFVIWIGSHESQGFAFQETQASNVPILLWDVKSMYDEYNNGWVYESFKGTKNPLLATTANCWNHQCGIKFYEEEQLEDAYDEMNEQYKTFSPRKLIEEKLSLKAAFTNLLMTIGVPSNTTTCTDKDLEILNKCFEKHSFNELNNIDVNILYNILSVFKSALTENSVIFDVGTNAGSFVKVLQHIMPNYSNIHCFEPHPILSKKTKSEYPRIKMNEFCLGNKDGEIDIYIPKWSVGLSSNIRRPVFDDLGQEIVTLRVKSQTIDSYCKEHKIEQIDFIKIDVEGAEKFVFDGASEMLKSKKIKAGVFEIGQTLKDAGTSTEEVCNLLENYGYTINKMFCRDNYVFHL